MLKHSSHLQKSIPAWIAVPEVFALHFCFTCTYYSNILWQLKPPEKYFPVYKNETTWILHNFAADGTGPVHLQCDKVFGCWIQYLLLQATPSYHPFHKTGEMGQVSRIRLEAQPIPSLQNLPNPWLICTCQGHMLHKPFWQKTFAPWTTAASCESAWTNPLDTAAASQLEVCMHTHTHTHLCSPQLTQAVCGVLLSLHHLQQFSLHLRWHLPPDSWCCLTSYQAEDGYLFIKRNKTSSLSEGEGE